MTMIEELVKKLAYLQAELKDEEDSNDADGIVITLREAVADRKKDLELANIALSREMVYYEAAVERINKEIEDIRSQIIDEWTGEHKTMVFDAGTLKFRTTQSLMVNNKPLLLEDLMNNLPTAHYIMRYLKGFNLVKLKDYVKTYPQPPAVVELVKKTTVKLEQKSG